MFLASEKPALFHGNVLQGFGHCFCFQPSEQPAQEMASEDMLTRAARFTQLCLKVLLKQLGVQKLED